MSENRRLAIKTFLEFSVSNSAKLFLPQSSSSKRLEIHAPSLIRTLLGLTSLERNSAAVPSGKRNFHIFYYLITGTSPERSTGTCPNAVRADDAHRFEQLKVALKTVSLSKRGIIQACQLVAAILHVGTLELTIDRSRDVDAAVVRNVSAFVLAAESLGVQPSALNAAQAATNSSY
ncbi:hypothetical protein EDD15DRAFT_2381475 [Pisolithus albus]|nr:hypothetical protein EDD15DRAFT_2381475 [Pisolithus albus]